MLKFRYYDSTYKKFVYSDDFSSSSLQSLALFFDSALKYSDGKIQQFTGLKDKNDKEIYEGDIVTAGQKEIFKISFAIGQYYMVNSDDVSAMDCYEFVGDYSESQKLLQIEVISNIFENPSLLSEKLLTM